MDSQLIQAALARYTAIIGGGNVPQPVTGDARAAAEAPQHRPVPPSEAPPTAAAPAAGLSQSELQSKPPAITQQHFETPQHDESEASIPSSLDVVSRIPGLGAMEEVLHSIPLDQKRAFLDACQCCPDLVRLESDPAAFLRRADYNVWAAARRLVMYWEGRREIFEERAFLPLNISGNGALAPEDVTVLRSGYQTILPPDGHGRPVVLFDGSKIEKDFSEKSLVRTFFFVRCVVAQCPTAQREGYTGIGFFNSSFLSYARVIRKMARLTEQLVPVVPNCLYMVGLSASFFFKLLRWLEPSLSISEKSVMVIGECPEEVGAKLAASNLNRHGLPSELGGSWDPSLFQAWLDHLDSLSATESYTKLGTSLLEPSQGSFVAVSDESKTMQVESTASATEKDVYDAIESMTKEQKSAYLEAKIECPDLLHKEMRPVAFLRCEEYDATDAAERMCGYWHCRRKIFKDRAFRAVDATGKGNLSESEVGRLDCGFLSVLPADARKRPVMFWNLACSMNIESTQEFARWWFYIFSVVAEDVVAQDEGSLLLVGIPDDSDATQVIDSSALELVAEVRRSMPIPLIEVHVVSVGSTHQNTQWWDQCIEFLKQIGRKVKIDQGLNVHKIAQTLMASGLQKGGIPINLGGEWKPHNEAAWRAERNITESKRYLTDATTDDSNVTIADLGSDKMPAYHPIKQLQKNESHYGASSSEGSTMSSGVATPMEITDNFSTSAAATAIFTENTMSDHIKAIDDAIMKLPAQDRSAYCRAKQEAPELIEKDSNPIIFLRFVNFNKVKCAKMLCSYWKDRLVYFEKRAFLPMNQTGEGTLTKKDVALMSTGHWAILPNDSAGRAVLFHDSSRRVRLDHKSQMRIMFYLNHVILQNENVAEQGIVGIIHVGTIPVEINQHHLKSVASVQKNNFPYKFHCIHIVPKVPRIFGVEVSVPLALSMFGADDAPWKLHRCTTRQEVLAKLGGQRLQKDGLPDIWGGDWNYEKFIMWQERQVRIEWELPLGVLDDDDGIYSARPLSDLNDGERKERKRRYNILHSRRKRRRDRVETDVLNRQVESLTDKKDELLEDRKCLEHLLQQASRLVDNVGADGSPVSRDDARGCTHGTSLLGGSSGGDAVSEQLAFASLAQQDALARSMDQVTRTRNANGAGASEQPQFNLANPVASGMFLPAATQFPNGAQYLGFGPTAAGQAKREQGREAGSAAANQTFMGLPVQQALAFQSNREQGQQKPPPKK